MKLILDDPTRPRLLPREYHEDEQIEIDFPGPGLPARVTLCVLDQQTGEALRYRMSPDAVEAIALGLLTASAIARAGVDGIRITLA